ncbi:MAG: 50S ribosome-binding GTPase [Nitrospinae bacterium]|nr:50S ribosome-binding GTPase [Nitrospinota bacterium]
MGDNKLKIVIVGHVDHGKSTLIGRLFYDTDSLPSDKIEEIRRRCEDLGREMEFAFLLDHLQEEREQGITIDTAQSFFKTDKRGYVIIDAPGHREFLKNMITGASQAECAILIVDAVDGVQEQTKRHAYILDMLGLKQVVVVINKMDLVDFNEKRFKEVKGLVEAFLDSINVKPSFFIPISAKRGDNVAKKGDTMSWYNGYTLLEALDTLNNQKSPVDKPLQFPVQDVYKIGDKRILVGRIENGRIKKGQQVVFLPSQKESIIKSIEVFMEDRIEAETGESIGITLKDPLFIERGEIICEKGYQPSRVDRFKANIFWMSQRPLDINERLTIRCATQEMSCTIDTIEKRVDSSSLETIERDADKLLFTEVGSVIIKTKKPIVIENFNEIKELGRFVLVRDKDTIAGGIVTHTSDLISENL